MKTIKKSCSFLILSFFCLTALPRSANADLANVITTVTLPIIICYNEVTTAWHRECENARDKARYHCNEGLVNYNPYICEAYKNAAIKICSEDFFNELLLQECGIEIPKEEVDEESTNQPLGVISVR